jgi:hypothetical protein
VADEVERVRFVAEHAGELLAASLADHDHDLALTGSVLPQKAIFTILAAVGRLHVAAENYGLVPFAR